MRQFLITFGLLSALTLAPNVVIVSPQVAQASDVLKTRVLEAEGGGRRVEADQAAPTRILTERRFDTADDFRDWCRRRCEQAALTVNTTNNPDLQTGTAQRYSGQ